MCSVCTQMYCLFIFLKVTVYISHKDHHVANHLIEVVKNPQFTPKMFWGEGGGVPGARPSPPTTDQIFFNFIGFFLRKRVKYIGSTPPSKGLAPPLRSTGSVPVHQMFRVWRELLFMEKFDSGFE